MFSTILKARIKFPKRPIRLIMTCLHPISLMLSMEILVDTYPCTHKFLQLSEYHTLNLSIHLHLLPASLIHHSSILFCKPYLWGSTIQRLSQTCLYLNSRLSITGTVILTKLNFENTIGKRLESTSSFCYSLSPLSTIALCS